MRRDCVGRVRLMPDTADLPLVRSSSMSVTSTTVSWTRSRSGERPGASLPGLDEFSARVDRTRAIASNCQSRLYHGTAPRSFEILRAAVRTKATNLFRQETQP